MKIRCRTLVVLSVVALLAIAASAFAQQPATTANPANTNTSQGGIGVGVEGGFARTTLSGDVVADYNSRNAGLIGLWVGGNKNGMVGFVGEFLYLQRKSGSGVAEV